MAKKIVKKRNPQDTTLRNTRAMITRVEAILTQIDDMYQYLSEIDERIQTLEHSAPITEEK